MAYVKCIRNLISSTVPDGKTVTPTDDISIWLACGGRSETYTTLSQVLADSACLSALINDNNAVDYLVRSTTWASDVCGDSGAMSAIGGNNYASNTLLADSTWLNAIANSAYRESVLNVKAPVMTSDNTPSGVCASVNSLNSGPAYKAFDNNNSTYVQPDAFPCVVGYTFESAKKIYVAIVHFTESVRVPSSFKIQYADSSALTNRTDIKEVTSPSVDTTIIFDSVVEQSSFCFYYDSGVWTRITEMQFYGRTDV